MTRLVAAGLVSLGVAVVSSTLQGEPLEETLRTLRNLNDHSSLEPAGSHGSIGVSAAVGALEVEAGSSPIYREAIGATVDDAERQKVLLPRAWLVKGFTWPIDLGLAATSMPNGSGTQVAGQLQWTIYEGLAMPAVSIRGSHARVFGLSRAEIRTDAFDALVSYGFLRYFTLFGSGGIARHHAVLSADRESDLSLLLANTEDERRFEERRIEPRRAVGLKVTVLPPFVSITTEARIENGEAASFAAKLSVGM